MLNHLATQQSSLEDSLANVSSKIDRLLGCSDSSSTAPSPGTSSSHVPLTASVSVPSNQRFAFTPASKRVPPVFRERPHSGTSCVPTEGGDTQPAEPYAFALTASERPFTSEGNSPIREPPPYSTATTFGTSPCTSNSTEAIPNVSPPRSLNRGLSGSAGSIPVEPSNGSPTDSSTNPPIPLQPWTSGTSNNVKPNKGMRSTSLTGEVPVLKRDKLHAQSERAALRKRQPFDMDITQLRQPETSHSEPRSPEPQGSSDDFQQHDMDNFIKLLEKNIPNK